MYLATEVKSVFLYGKPTKKKLQSFIKTQKGYTDLINFFIKKLSEDKKYYLDIFNNNKNSPLIRGLEKSARSFHRLGSAYGQNAIDHAMKELHNHFMRIRNKLYGYVQSEAPGVILYISFLSLLNASIQETNEFDILDKLLDRARSAKKQNKGLIEAYENVYSSLQKLTEDQRASYRSYVRSLFYEKLDYWKLPFVKKATLQLDARVSTIEKSHSTKEDFVVSIKLLNEPKRQEFPVSTSENGLRRLAQYKNSSLTATVVNGKIKIGIPISKKVSKQKQVELLGIDLGITDLFYTSTQERYGTFFWMVRTYEETLEKKLGNRSTLRNKRKKYQKQLKRSNNFAEKEWLSKKIKNISDNLNGKKTLQKQRKKYAYVVDMEVSKAVKCLFNEIKAHQYIPVFEDLEMDTFDRGKKANKRDSSWVRGKVMKKITDQLKWHGYDWVTVDPAYTSKMCQQCNNIHDDNRKGKRFTCTVCRYTSDADFNAAVNIRERALDKEVSSIVEKYRYSTKKRHWALKGLLKTRHCSYMSSVA